MTLTYRPALPGDAEEIYQLSKEIIERFEDPTAVDLNYALKWTHDDVMAHWADYTRILADGEPAGYYALKPMADGTAELSLLALYPPFRGQGIGTQVLRRCLELAPGDVTLFVFTKNTVALHLYESTGFQVIANIKNSRLHMRRKKDGDIHPL